MAINPDVLDAIYGMSGPGMGGGQHRGPEFLQTEKRTAMSRIALNTGTAYLAGAAFGGLFGAVSGFRATDSKIFKIRLNGTVNGIEGGVGRFGNALGVLSLTYSIIDALGETFGVHHLLPSEYAEDLTPVLSATATGFFYKMFTSPKQAILAAGIGGTLMGTYTLLQDFLPRDVLKTIKQATF